jgi:hypothetical protein
MPGTACAPFLLVYNNASLLSKSARSARFNMKEDISPRNNSNSSKLPFTFGSENKSPHITAGRSLILIPTNSGSILMIVKSQNGNFVGTGVLRDPSDPHLLIKLAHTVYTTDDKFELFEIVDKQGTPKSILLGIYQIANKKVEESFDENASTSSFMKNVVLSPV